MHRAPRVRSFLVLSLAITLLAGAALAAPELLAVRSDAVSPPARGEERDRAALTSAEQSLGTLLVNTVPGAGAHATEDRLVYCFDDGHRASMQQAVLRLRAHLIPLAEHYGEASETVRRRFAPLAFTALTTRLRFVTPVRTSPRPHLETTESILLTGADPALVLPAGVPPTDLFRGEIDRTQEDVDRQLDDLARLRKALPPGKDVSDIHRARTGAEALLVVLARARNFMRPDTHARYQAQRERSLELGCRDYSALSPS